MRGSAFRVDIDRIVLIGLDVAPDSASFIREQVEAELTHRLQRDGLPRGPAGGGQVNRLRTPQMHLPRPPSDGSVAGALASSISDALRRAGSSGRG
jgi:hypothetical protein